MCSNSWQLCKAYFCACKTDDTCVCIQGKEKESAAQIKRFMMVMDSMTRHKLNSADIETWQHNAALKRSTSVMNHL